MKLTPDIPYDRMEICANCYYFRNRHIAGMGICDVKTKTKPVYKLDEDTCKSFMREARERKNPLLER